MDTYLRYRADSDDALKQADEALRVHIASLKTEATKQKTANTKLSSKLDSFVKDFDSLKTKVTSLSDELADTKGELATVRGELADVKKDVQNEATIAKLKFTNLEKDLAIAKNAPAVYNNEVASIKKDLVIVQQDTRELQVHMEEQDGFIGQLARRVDPFGRWRWFQRTARDVVGGHWGWLMAGAALRRTVQPPVVFSNLPNEILQAIASHLSKKDKLNLALVCFRWFDLLAKELYSKAEINENNLGAFLAAKLFFLSYGQGRLNPLRSTAEITLTRANSNLVEIPSSVAIPLQPTPRPILIQVDRLRVHLGDFKMAVGFWYPFLAMTDPKVVFFTRSKVDNEIETPTKIHVSPALLLFAQRWERLETGFFFGLACVPLQSGTSCQLAFQPGGRTLSSIRVVRNFKDGVTKSDPVAASVEALLEGLETVEVGANDLWVGVKAKWAKPAASASDGVAA